MTLHVNTPFLSGQMSSKCCKSSDGRSLSIGTQYLRSKSCGFTAGGTQRNKPYRVQSIPQSLLPRLTTDKLLHNPQLFLTARLKSARVVENVTVVLREYELVFDVVQATLQAASSRSAVTDKNKPLQPLLRGRAGPS